MRGRAFELVFGPTRAILRSGLIWTVCIPAIVLMTISIWPAFKGDQSISNAMLSNLPSGLVDAFGLQDFGSPAGFLRANLYDFFIPLLMACSAIGFVNSLTSSEEDAGRLEVVLAQPVRRQQVFLGRAIAVFVWVVVVTAVTAVVQFGSDALFDLEIGADRMLATLVLCGLLAAFTGGLSLAVAGLSGKPSLVLGVGLFVAVGGCIVDTLFPLSSSLAEFARLSPWNWALSGDPLVNPTDAWRYLALGVPAVAMAIFGVWAFGRRDVAAA